MTIDLGMGFEELEKQNRPPIIPDGTYEFMVDRIEDSPVGSGGKKPGRPQWKAWLKIVNRPDIGDRQLPFNMQLPWVDPATGQIDAAETFGLTDFLGGITINGQPAKSLLLNGGRTLPEKEVFVGGTGFVKVGHKARKDDPEVIDNSTKIITPKKGGGIVN